VRQDRPHGLVERRAHHTRAAELVPHRRQLQLNLGLEAGHGRWGHSDAAAHVSLVTLHTKHTKRSLTE
jgi:hypothetical protein